MVKQTLENQRGEVEFRKQLYKDFLSKKKEEESRGFKEIVKSTQRHLENTRKAFKKTFSLIPKPAFYIDLGSASCLRSFVLENEYGIPGIAIDLSFDTLLFVPILAKGLGYKKLPLRVCADIHHLPLLSSLAPFIFTFQTLHHLPDPTPVLLEVKRVLQNEGYFYFGEEPVKQLFNLRLWRRRAKKRWYEKLLMLVGLLPFITDIGGEEVEFGIAEERFWLDEWEKFISFFDKAKIWIKPYRIGQAYETESREKKDFLKPPLLTKFLLFLLGGGIDGLCQMNTHPVWGDSHTGCVYPEILACPKCKKPLKKNQGFLDCPSCLEKFKIKDGIYILLDKEKRETLYGNRFE